MRICIVTVYDSINSGSFWQAKSLNMALEKMGHQVYFLKRAGDKSGSSTSKSNQIKKYLSLLLRQGITKAALYRKRLSEYRKSVNEFETVTVDRAITDMDCFVLGSDTIWNLNSPYFLQHRSEYWGEPFLSKKVITYAGSAANTSTDRLKEYPELIECVRKWNSISVRDGRTKEMISSVTDKEVIEVCDPTLLLTSDQYPDTVRIKEDSFVFLYLFEPLNAPQIEELCNFAKKDKMKIVQGAGDKRYPGVDSMSINGPFQFISYMKRAEYVITDTFHGTIFSTVFEKNFVVIDRKKQKITDYLRKVQLSDRIVKPEDSVVSLLSKIIDYSSARLRIKELREVGLHFLSSSMEES